MNFGEYYSNYLKPFALTEKYNDSKSILVLPSPTGEREKREATKSFTNKNFVKIEKSNPLCGDKVTFYYRKDSKNNIAEIYNHIEGCRVIQASANILCSTVQGKTVEEIKQICKQLQQKIFSDHKVSIDIEMQPWQYLWLANQFPARLKCVWLPWELFSSISKNL